MTEKPKVGDKPPAGTVCSETRCYHPAKYYAIRYGYSGEEKGTGPVPLCGVHSTMYAKRKADADRREKDRLDRERERKERSKRITIATNLASMLSDDLAGISFSPSGDGRTVAISVDDAKKLRERIAELPAPVRRSLALSD